MTEAKKRILIVEDDIDLAEMLDAYFQVQGYVIERVSWGEDAVRAATIVPPDLILLDIRLPDIDGYEVCRRLRQSHRTSNVPVMFLTEKHAKSDRLTGLSLGAVDYITKPFDIKELHLRVRNSLRRAGFSALHNAITNLPESALVEEQLKAMLDKPEWAVVYVDIENLSHFRDQQGFVAADDVVRAIGHLLRQTLDRIDSSDSFLGHADNTSFFLIGDYKLGNRLARACQDRIDAVIPYFYPDAVIHSISVAKKLKVNVRLLTSAAGAKDLTSLQQQLNQM